MTHLASASRRRTPGESRRIYAYDQNGNLLEETGGGRSPIDYVYLDGKPIAEILPVTGQVYYLHDDRLGTPQIVTDGSQNIVWGAVYQPFGAASILVGAITQNLRLPGQYFDRGDGLNYNLNRDYVPTWGRYLEADPVGLAAGLNSYRYASDNAEKFTDRVGLANAYDQNQVNDAFRKANPGVELLPEWADRTLADVSYSNGTNPNISTPPGDLEGDILEFGPKVLDVLGYCYRKCIRGSCGTRGGDLC